MKRKAEKLFNIGHIFNIILLIAEAAILVWGLFDLLISNPQYAQGPNAEARAGYASLGLILTCVASGFLVVTLVNVILGSKAKKWPYPNIPVNYVFAITSLLTLNVFNTIGAFLNIKAAKEDPSITDDSKHMGVRSKRIMTNTISYVVLALISLIWILPFVFIVFESFKCETTMQTEDLFPQKWGFDNFLYLFSADCNFLQWYFNTFIIATACCIIQTIMQLMMSYTLSRFRFKLRKPLMNVMLILGMFPGFLTMLVLYQVLKSIGLTQGNAVGGLILVGVASSGMGYYVSKGFFDTIPKSLDEAARVDGANRAQVFYKIILPLAKPIVIYTILTGFMGPWGDFIFASLIAFGQSSGYNVAVGLNSWLTKEMISQHYTHFCAGGVVVAIPVITLFLFLQKYYVEGVTGGAVKG